MREAWWRGVALSGAALVLAVVVTACGGTATSLRADGAAAVIPDPCSADSAYEAHGRAVCTRAGDAREQMQSPAPASADATCATPAYVGAYAQDDWIGLARTFAAAPDGCLEAWISVPTEQGADGAWLTTRRGMKERFAAIGANVHPLPQVDFDDWNAWGVRHPDVSWLERGRRARAEMEAAGYDFDRGDLWALNEVPYATLVDPTAREAVRQLVEGLQGATASPTGVIYVVMAPQSSGPTPELERELRAWFADAPFWDTMQRATAAWSSEAYASIRDTCQPGTTAERQVAALGAYAFHRQALAERLSSPAERGAQAVLARDVPLTNAAWSWTEAYGWTAADPAVMERFVALQVAAAGREIDGRFASGVGWAPKRPAGMSEADFAQAIGRIAGAYRDAVVQANATRGRFLPPACSESGSRLAAW